MKRLLCIKYVATLLVSSALTFHFLQSRTSSTEDLSTEEDRPHGYAFTKSKTYLQRRLSQRTLITPHWAVLGGNVTVHVGNERVAHDVSYVVNAESLCDTFDAVKKKLLIFVASSVDHVAQRSALRQTWALKLLQDAYNYRVVFLVGQGPVQTADSIAAESFRYGDLVQINLTESYRNLGRKSVAGLQWAKVFCADADYVMKTDDDILVHVPNLLRALESAKDPQNLLMCHENHMRKILRKSLLDRISLPPSYTKYEVSVNELPGDFYPPYCSGMAYIFSSNSRDRILKACLNTPIFFIEDVYLTGFCRHKAGVDITPHAGISLRPAIELHQAACSFRDGRITSQEVGVDELQKMWAELNTQGFFCPQLLGYARKRPKSLLPLSVKS